MRTLIATIAALAITHMCAAQDAVEASRAHRQANGAEILRSFAELLSIPNVYPDLANLRRRAA